MVKIVLSICIITFLYCYRGNNRECLIIVKDSYTEKRIQNAVISTNNGMFVTDTVGRAFINLVPHTEDERLEIECIDYEIKKITISKRNIRKPIIILLKPIEPMFTPYQTQEDSTDSIVFISSSGRRECYSINKENRIDINIDKSKEVISFTLSNSIELFYRLDSLLNSIPSGEYRCMLTGPKYSSKGEFDGTFLFRNKKIVCKNFTSFPQKSHLLETFNMIYIIKNRLYHGYKMDYEVESVSLKKIPK